MHAKKNEMISCISISSFSDGYDALMNFATIIQMFNFKCIRNKIENIGMIFSIILF